MLDLPALYAECAEQVHPKTMDRVVHVESGGNAWAIHVNGPNGGSSESFATVEQAIARTEQLDRAGRDYDAGLGQVNVRNRRRLGLTAAQLFEPCTNLRVSASILASCYDRSIRAGNTPGNAALAGAFACYNSGSLNVVAVLGYVSKYGVLPPPSGGTISAEVKPLPAQRPKPANPMAAPMVVAGWEGAIAGVP